MSFKKIRKAVEAAVRMHVQANTNSAIRNLGSRGQLLDEAMADLADAVPVGWHRSLDGEWVAIPAVPAPPALKAKVYPIVKRAVEEGALMGYRRAHKHTQTPSEEAVVEAVEAAIMLALSEVIDFGDE